MAELLEVESAMVNRIKNGYNQMIRNRLNQISAALPTFVGEEEHRARILEVFGALEADVEYNAALTAEARDKLTAAIDALDDQTKTDLGIDHLFTA